MSSSASRSYRIFRPRLISLMLFLRICILGTTLIKSVVTVQEAQHSDAETLWVFSPAEIVQDRSRFKSEILDSVPDLVPLDVQCERIKRCDTKNVCAIVCKPGSVQVEKWLQKALKLQRKLAYDRNFCSGMVAGSHNSAITLADGYGLEDHVFEGFLRYFSWFDESMKVQTNDQLFSLTDLLQMGVRFIELDVHWVDGDLRIAHCGGFQSKLLDGMIAAFNVIAKLLGTDIEWDSGTIGCEPSLSSIPSKDQRALDEALSELSTWLHAPEHMDEFLIVFFDDQSNLMKWGKVGKLLDSVKRFFSEDEMLRPIELVPNTKWPTIIELLDVGKRVAFMSGADYLTQGEELLFVKDHVCNWQEPPMPLSPFPECQFYQSKTDSGVLAENLTIARPETSEIQYGILNAFGSIGVNTYVLDENSLPVVSKCGVNIPSPDNITPKRMEATLWCLSHGRELEAGKCVALLRGTRTWQSVDCESTRLVPACVHVDNPRHWQLGGVPGVEANGAVICAALSLTMRYSVPASGYENELLYGQLMRQNSNSIDGVWLNAGALVRNLYSSDLSQSPIKEALSVE